MLLYRWKLDLFYLHLYTNSGLIIIYVQSAFIVNTSYCFRTKICYERNQNDRINCFAEDKDQNIRDHRRRYSQYANRPYIRVNSEDEILRNLILACCDYVLYNNNITKNICQRKCLIYSKTVFIILFKLLLFFIIY